MHIVPTSGMGLSSKTRFGFEHIERSGKHPPCRNAASKGKRKGHKASREGWKRVLHMKGTYADVVSSSDCFPFCQPGSHDQGRRDSHGVANWLMEGYGDIVDIYSCFDGLVVREQVS